MAWIAAVAAAVGTVGAAAAKGGSAVPTSANSVFDTKLAFDNSGWNVSFGNSKIDSTANKSADLSGGSSQSQWPLGMGGGSDMTMYAVAFVGVILLWRMTKKSS